MTAPEPTTAQMLAQTQDFLDTLVEAYESARQAQVQSGWFLEPRQWAAPTQQDLLLEKVRDRWQGRPLS